MSVNRCRLPFALSLASLALLTSEPATAQLATQKGITQAAPSPVAPGPLIPGGGTTIPGDTIGGGPGEIDLPETSQDPYAIPGAQGKALGRTIVVGRSKASAQKRAVDSRVTFETGLDGPQGARTKPMSSSS